VIRSPRRSTHWPEVGSKFFLRWTIRPWADAVVHGQMHGSLETPLAPDGEGGRMAERGIRSRMQQRRPKRDQVVVRPVAQAVDVREDPGEVLSADVTVEHGPGDVLQQLSAGRQPVVRCHRLADHRSPIHAGRLP
jgi:hypothetical protein